MFYRIGLQLRGSGSVSGEMTTSVTSQGPGSKLASTMTSTAKDTEEAEPVAQSHEANSSKSSRRPPAGQDSSRQPQSHESRLSGSRQTQRWDMVEGAEELATPMTTESWEMPVTRDTTLSGPGSGPFRAAFAAKGLPLA